MELKALLCIACGCSHCNDKVRCCAGARAQEAKAPKVEAKLADENSGGWDYGLVDESSEEGGNDVVNVGWM